MPSETRVPDAQDLKMTRAMNEQETAYMKGDAKPIASSVLISTSKYLNSPLFRDAFIQQALRRVGTDLPVTYGIPEMIRALKDVTDFGDFFAETAKEKARNPEFRAWLDERRLTYYKPGMLKGYGAGTLGESIRAFVEDSGMQMEFTGLGEAIQNDFDYMTKRRSMCHDIEHIVSGFPPNTLGEVALAVCNNVSLAGYFPPVLANHMFMTTTFVSLAAIMRTSLHYPAAMPHLFEAVRLGIVMGQALKKPFFMVQWEDYLDWTLDDICGELGIERGPDKAWDAPSMLARD